MRDLSGNAPRASSRTEKPGEAGESWRPAADPAKATGNPKSPRGQARRATGGRAGRKPIPGPRGLPAGHLPLGTLHPRDRRAARSHPPGTEPAPAARAPRELSPPPARRVSGGPARREGRAVRAARRELPRWRPGAWPRRGPPSRERSPDSRAAGQGSRDRGRESHRGPSRAGMRRARGRAGLRTNDLGPGAPPSASRPSPSAPRPAAPGPGSPTAATVATRVSQTGRSPSEEKFPQWPRAAGTYSLSPLVGQSESAAEKNRSPHSEVGDPPPELDFIPFIWDEIPLSQKKKRGGWRRKRKSLRVFVSRPPPKTRAKATPLPEAAPAGGPRGGADGAGGGGGRPSAPAAAAQRSAESGTRGAPGRAVCVVGLHFQTQRGRREEKLRREGGQARIRLGEGKQTRPQTEGEAARRPSLRGGRARRSSQDCPGARVAGEAGRGQKCGGKMNEPLPSSSSCCSSSAGLRSPPPPPPPRAPSQIQDTHKAAGRPRSALPPPAPRRPPPAAGSARGLRLAEGQSRGAPWSSPRAGGAWRARGSASSRHGRAGARLAGGVPLPRPPLEFAWCARSSSGCFFFFPSPRLFFFFRSAELMLVNKSLSPAAPLPPPLPHTGA